jgi:hypothetical protein
VTRIDDVTLLIERPCWWPFKDAAGEGRTPAASCKLMVWDFEGKASRVEEERFAASLPEIPLEVPRRPGGHEGLGSILSGLLACSFWGNVDCLAVETPPSVAASSLGSDEGRGAVETGEGTIKRSEGWIEGE